MTATKRIQFLDYELVRSGRFNTNELALLNIIQSFSERCSLKQSDLARMMCKSVPTVARTIKSLIDKGIVTRRYTVFKRCVLVIVSLAVQKTLKAVSGMIKQAFRMSRKRLKKSMKSSYLSPMTELIPSPMTEPTRSETKEIKPINIDKSFDIKPIRKSLEELKNEAIARYKKHIC